MRHLHFKVSFSLFFVAQKKGDVRKQQTVTFVFLCRYHSGDVHPGLCLLRVSLLPHAGVLPAAAR